jgi:hypothetical protein
MERTLEDPGEKKVSPSSEDTGKEDVMEGLSKVHGDFGEEDVSDGFPTTKEAMVDKIVLYLASLLICLSSNSENYLLFVLLAEIGDIVFNSMKWRKEKGRIGAPKPMTLWKMVESSHLAWTCLVYPALSFFDASSVYHGFLMFLFSCSLSLSHAMYQIERGVETKERGKFCGIVVVLVAILFTIIVPSINSAFPLGVGPLPMGYLAISGRADVASSVGNVTLDRALISSNSECLDGPSSVELPLASSFESLMRPSVCECDQPAEVLGNLLRFESEESASKQALNVMGSALFTWRMVDAEITVILKSSIPSCDWSEVLPRAAKMDCRCLSTLDYTLVSFMNNAPQFPAVNEFCKTHVTPRLLSLGLTRDKISWRSSSSLLATASLMGTGVILFGYVLLSSVRLINKPDDVQSDCERKHFSPHDPPNTIPDCVRRVKESYNEDTMHYQVYSWLSLMRLLVMCLPVLIIWAKSEKKDWSCFEIVNKKYILICLFIWTIVGTAICQMTLFDV